MLKTFSIPLVEKCKEYFHRVHHMDISDDTANEYLRSFAKLYLAFNRPNGGSVANGNLSAVRNPAVADEVIEGSSLTRKTHIRTSDIQEKVMLDSMHKGSVTNNTLWFSAPFPTCWLTNIRR